jgi:hypothetical protein
MEPVGANGNGHANGNGNGHANGNGDSNGHGFEALTELTSRSSDALATVRAFGARRIENAAFGEPDAHDDHEPEHAAPRASTAPMAAAPAAPRIEPAQTTEQKIEAFYGARQDGDEVLFAARFEEARKVMIAGDFNNWTPVSTPMARDNSGQWRIRLPLPRGRYKYRLVVDGQWMTDPNNTAVEQNEFGEYNNVVEVA